MGGGWRVEGGEGWDGPGQPPSLPQPERVLLALRRYLRAEQKEQRHTLRHYQHVAAVDPEKAQQMRFQVLSSSSSKRSAILRTLVSWTPSLRCFSCPSDPLSFLAIHLFIYFCGAELGLCCCARAFSSCGEWGLLFLVVLGRLTAAVSLVVEHRLEACGLQ